MVQLVETTGKWFEETFCARFAQCIVSLFTLTLLNSTKSDRDIPPKMQHVVLCNHPSLSIGTEGLSKQPPWHAAGDFHLECDRSPAQGLTPVGALRAIFSPPSLPSPVERFFHTFPTNTPLDRLGLITILHT